MRKTKEAFQALLNRTKPPKRVETSNYAVRLVPYGNWLRRKENKKFNELFEKWKGKS